MRRIWVLVVVALAVSGLVPADRTGAQEGGGGPPVLAGLTVTGTEVSTYPAFAPTTRRFGIRTTPNSTGFTVTATTSNPDDVLTIGGVPATSGQPRSFRTLKPGEALTVRVSNSGGGRAYDLVYLPPSYPIVNVTTRRAGIAPGLLFLGFFTGSPFNVVMDNNGVPVYVNRRTVPPFDFKPQPGGRYSFLERSGQQTSAGRDIFDAVILNSAMQEIRRRRTVAPLTSTDNHDILLLPNGHRIQMAYEPVMHDGVLREDSVVQEIDAAGHEVLRWSSWGNIPLSDNLSGNLTEWAHMNSVWVDNDNNLLVSLRGTSQIVKINRRSGRTMWVLGGRSNDFQIDDPLDAFCGQHHAQRLPNGHLLLFDNATDCRPDGHDRAESRAAEYAIDEVHHTARLVWSHSQGINTFATGSVQRLANGNTLIGWGTAGTVTEVNHAGEILWETTPRTPSNAITATYRIQRAPFPDAMRPRVAMPSPAPNATFLQGQQVRASWFCVDEGGSSLAGCDGSVRSGTLLDTDTPGPHTVEVTATDEAGNVRELTRTYDVTPNQPDVTVQLEPDGQEVGGNVYSRTGAGQTRTAAVHEGGEAVFTVGVQNDGTDEDTFIIHGSPHDAHFAVRYLDGDRDVTAAVKDGSYRFRGLQPGDRHRLEVHVTARPGIDRGEEIEVFLSAASAADPTRRDVGKLVVRRIGVRSG